MVTLTICTRWCQRTYHFCLETLPDTGYGGRAKKLKSCLSQLAHLALPKWHPPLSHPRIIIHLIDGREVLDETPTEVFTELDPEQAQLGWFRRERDADDTRDVPGIHDALSRRLYAGDPGKPGNDS